MKTYLKAILAVTGGVVGVGGGTVAVVTLRQSGRNSTLVGGGDQSLSNLSSTDTEQGTITTDSPVEVTERVLESEQSSSTEVDSLKETAISLPTSPIKEEKKENCKVIDFSKLNDVFDYIIREDYYTLVFCAKTNKDTDTSNKFPSQWKGLFPSNLFSDKVKEFQLVTETTVLGENITTVFSSEQFSPSSVTGKFSDIFQNQEETFRVQQIDLEELKAGKIFLFLIEQIDSLMQKS